MTTNVVMIFQSSVVIPTSMAASIAPPGLAIPTTLATVQVTSLNYQLNTITQNVNLYIPLLI